ncbi:MAG: putative metal-binding motif-containing protein [Patescibacteria group bacterium]
MLTAFSWGKLMLSILVLLACAGSIDSEKPDTASVDSDTAADTSLDTAEVGSDTAIDSGDSADDTGDSVDSEDSGCETQTWYADHDGDGYGDATISTSACDQPIGYVVNDGDCDDWQPEQNPGAGEVCNGADDNCDGEVPAEEIDADADGYSGCTAAVDCDDTNPAVSPGVEEVCNGIDDDCDHNVDGDAVDKTVWFLDSDGDGYGAGLVMIVSCVQPYGATSEDGDCDDTNLAVNPAGVESCNGLDDDCNGVLDDDADSSTLGANPYYRDQDVDYAGDVLDTSPQWVCSTSSEIAYSDSKGLMTWISENNLDCVDIDSMIGPSVLEVPYNGTDENCDGSDEH